MDTGKIGKKIGRKPTGATSVPEANGHAAAPAADPAPAPAVLCDALGVPVPERLRPVFELRAKFASVRRALKEQQNAIHEIGSSKGGEEYHGYLRLVGKLGHEKLISPHIAQELEHLAWAEPYSCTCPACHHVHPGKVEPSCRTCGGRGWVIKRVWESCDEDHRRAVLKLARQEAAS